MVQHINAPVPSYAAPKRVLSRFRLTGVRGVVFSLELLRETHLGFLANDIVLVFGGSICLHLNHLLANFPDSFVLLENLCIFWKTFANLKKSQQTILNS